MSNIFASIEATDFWWIPVGIIVAFVGSKLLLDWLFEDGDLI